MLREELQVPGRLLHAEIGPENVASAGEEQEVVLDDSVVPEHDVLAERVQLDDLFEGKALAGEAGDQRAPEIEPVVEAQCVEREPEVWG